MRSSNNDRALFQMAKQILTDKGYNAANAILSQSALRLETAVVAGKTTYEFPIKENETTGGATLFNTERRLGVKDAFFANVLGIFLVKPSSSTDSSAPLLTFCNEVAGLNAEYEKVYNGSMKLTTNGRVIIPYWDLLRHKVVPETQNATGIKMQNRGIHDGFVGLEPNIIFSGSEKNLLEITLPESIGTIVANTRIVVIARGALAQNVN